MMGQAPESIKNKCALVEVIIASIEQAKTTADLEGIINTNNWRQISEEIDDKYPDFALELNDAEIRSLRKKGILNHRNQLNVPLRYPVDPLGKLLLSLVWKNGDVHKLQHIADGITDQINSASKQNLVFRQFGRSLSAADEPIVDQHVLRAFACHIDPKNALRYCRVSIFKNADENLLKQYRIWFRTQLTRMNGENPIACRKLIDRLLFITGKVIKSGNTKK